MEEERRRVEELRRRWEEKEEVVSGQPESQKEQLTLQQVGSMDQSERAP